MLHAGQDGSRRSQMTSPSQIPSGIGCISLEVCLQNHSEGHSKTRTLPLRLTPLPRAAARKAPRLCSGKGYLIRWRCRRLYITRGHIAHQHLIVPVSHRICARLADCRPRNYRTGSQRLRVFRCGTNDSAPLQNSKPLALPVAI